MKSFSRHTAYILIASALVLAGGVYYQGVAAKRVEEAKQALSRVQSSQMQLRTAQARAAKYLELLDGMADQKVDRQEPFSVDSEFTPREIEKIGSLLDTLYQRDGYFFLQRFELAWRRGQQGGMPRVELELDGEKVLLFSRFDTGATTVATAHH